MATYVVGDVQGCFVELQALLASVQFDLSRDHVWFTGDLVNRGPQSLETLRFVKSLGDRQVTVLGNHDLHLIAAAYGVGRAGHGDTLEEILAAEDRDDLIHWLRHRPLVHADNNQSLIIVHAGLAPCWGFSEAVNLAREVEYVLQSDKPKEFLAHMYGNQPDHWDDRLESIDRWRCIVNYLTRMRFCHADGRLDLSYKGQIKDKPAELIPWFDVPGRKNADVKIIFGHWAALNGQADVSNVYPLDTGCVWGNRLTALRLDDFQLFSVPSSRKS